MVRWQPARADVVAEYAREVTDVVPRGRVLVGLDGVDLPLAGDAPSDREAFADDLAAALRAAGTPALAVRLGAHLAADPFAADPDPERLVDVAALRDRVVRPFRAGDPLPGPDGAFDPGERAVLVVSGPFAHLGDLAGMWHTSAWLQVPRAEAYRREAARLGLDPAGPELTAWAATVDRAFRRSDARKRARATVDLTDPAHPRRVFEDAC